VDHSERVAAIEREGGGRPELPFDPDPGPGPRSRAEWLARLVDDLAAVQTCG
jgi:hypothetical protein